MNKLKNQAISYNEGGASRSPERVSIHGNSPSPIRHQGTMGTYPQQKKGISSSAGSSQSTQNSNSHFLGANIDGIPFGNRSPPRNSNTVNGGFGANAEVPSPNL